jgi:ATPase subunit of ABC transporter with duplicated ATPase domains
VISLSNVGKTYGDRALFEGVTMRLLPGERYGMVGANGSGKSTLLHVLRGEEPLSDGEISIPNATRIGVLEQDRYLSDAQRILDVAMMGDESVWAAMQEKEALLAASVPDAEALAAVEERIAHEDGYTLDSRAAAILEGLGIPAEVHQRELSTLSGGFKLRVLLGQTLVGNPDLLLLDEPTNHLDILTIQWLEGFLSKFEGCAMIVSHDHRFLDNVATQILDVDYATITLYPGNYSRFVEQKRQTRERKELEIERQQQVIAQKKAFVERFRAKATKARQAQSRAKQIEKIEVEELAQSSRRAPHFVFEQVRPSGKEVVMLNAIDKAFGDKVVLRDVSLTIRRGERIAVIGANGLGKSTLLKILVERLDPDDGELKWGYETYPGYFAQDHRDLLENEPGTVLEYLWSIIPQQTTSFVRGQLGKMLFSGEDVEKKTKSLSGGEAARVIFSRLIVQKPNVLVLDEPTNHLDLESIEALVVALKKFEGTLLFVSHDRWFVSELATRIVEITPDGLSDYAGTYQEYLAHRGADHLDADAVAEQARRDKELARSEAAKGAAGDFEAHKKRRAEHKKAIKRRDEVTESIESTEARLAEIEQRYCEPGFFESNDKATIDALEAEQLSLRGQVEALMEEWETLELSIEALADEIGA